jgi:uncharacterized membrane protein YphA (DoxX/SURF4 family)/thiol-disulfide isomerase/thioredoxin
VDALLLALRVALAVVFAIAAVGKLRDRRGSRRAMADFGVPDRLSGVIVGLLPVAELLVAAGLLPAATARWAAIAALILLLGFTGAITRALSQGRSPDCHCFGQLHSEPAGPGALARNGALAAGSAIIVWSGPGPTVADWLAGRTAIELALVAISAAGLTLALVCLHLARDNRRLKRELQAAQRNRGLASGLPIGAPAPGFALAEAGGQTQTLETLRSRGLPLVLVFMDPGCGPCRALLPELERWQLTLSQALTLAVITRDGSDRTDPAAGQDGLANVLLQKRSEVSDAYRIGGTPSAVVVSPNGTIASSPAAGAPAIEAVIRVTLQREQAPRSPTALRAN